MKLLYAEDNLVFRDLLTKVLVKWGFEVEVTADGADAFRRLTQPGGPRLAVLDWSMPGLDGVEICRRIRAGNQGSYVYIILLTAHDERDDLIQGMEAGADDFLSKPVDLDQLRLRLRAAIRLLDFEERSRNLFQEAPVAYHETDQGGTIVRVNRAECKLLGYAASEMLGKPVWEFVAPKHRDESRRAILAKLQGDAIPPVIEREFLTREGACLTLQIHENRIRDEHGRVAGLRSALLDVTDRRRQEEERVKYTAELARSNAELQKFAYVASHDLQEPLRMVVSYTQLLAHRYKGKLDNDADEFIGFAVDGARRMQALIVDLLAYSRVGTRGDPLRSTDAGASLERALGNLKMAIQESGAVVTCDRLPAVVADPVELSQVFQNLIANAVKFRNGNVPVVHIGAAAEGDLCRFWVRDNGIGIEARFTEQIFQVFQRLHNIAEYPGTGIGLAICRKIAERHGGRIWVESEPGHGSTFHFTIPFAEKAGA